MTSVQPSTTTNLTVRYVLALSALGMLALLNYLLFRAEVREEESTAEVLNISGRQRMLMAHTALLAQELVATSDADPREQLRFRLRDAVQRLEAAHYRLIWIDAPAGSRDTDAPSEDDVVDSQPQSKVQRIYFDAPWLLDTEVRNYVAQIRALADSPAEDLTPSNPHLDYVREVALSNRVIDGLDEVVTAYQLEIESKTANVRRLAYWSFLSTYVVLALTGLFVFRPMVHRVREEMDALEDLNETLEERVAERTALAERRAGEVQASEALYHSLVDNLPMCVIRKDREGRFAFVNERFGRLLGRPVTDVLGRTDFDFYSAELAEKYRRDDLQVMQRDGVFEDVEEHTTPDGRTLFVEVRKLPLCDATGNVFGTQTVFWDVTERMVAERERRQMQEKLLQSERLAAIGEMVAGVAHESRNALQKIQACTQLLDWQLHGKNDGKVGELLQDIQQAQDRLHRLFDDLRGYASPLRLDRRRCDLRHVMRQAWKSALAPYNGRKALFAENGADADAYCWGDPFQLEQVFRNLLENSLAACEGPAAVEADYDEVDFRSRPALRIRLRDNGPGLTPEARQHVFEPFFTTKTHGTGLGTAIARRIVEAHGGGISVEDQVGSGTEFVVILPRADA